MGRCKDGCGGRGAVVFVRPKDGSRELTLCHSCDTARGHAQERLNTANPPRNEWRAGGDAR